MKLTKYAVISLIFIFIVKLSNSQSLLKSQNGTDFTYIYKLDNKSALEILKTNQIKDSPKYFTNLVDSFPNSKPNNYMERLEPGQYILYKAQGRIIYFNLLEISDVIVKVNGLNSKNNIYVYDLKGEPITNNIKLYNQKDEEIPRNEKLKCWTLANINKEVQYFYIINDSALTYYKLQRNKIVPTKNYNRRSHSTILPGYFVLNQPAYKKNDSLIFKAFLLKRNGKPYNKTVSLKIFDQKIGKYNLIKDLKPLSRGAYTYAFQIPDSFNLDSYYQIYLTNKRGNVLKDKSFKVENYQIKNATYEARMEKNYFYRGEPVYLHLSCFDVNDLPMADTKISVNIRISEIQDFMEDSMFIPYSWQSTSYWSMDLYSDPSGNTEILLPDSLFLNAKMRFYANIKFINADGESSEKNLNFNFDPQKERYLFYQVDDSIQAIYLENSIIKPKPARIVSYYTKMLEEKQVTLPYTFHIEEFPKYYSLFEDSIHKATIFPKTATVDLVKFDGYRNYDSLVLNLINNAGVNVSYWVYQKDKLLFEGNSVDFSIKEAIKGGKPVDIIYTYRLAGEKYTFVQSFHHKKKSLKVESNIPRKIFPGQEVVVKMNVKNHKGKNRKNVNLAAYSINAKVEGIESPDMPYFGKTKTGQFYTHKTYLSKVNINVQKTIDTNYLNWLNLRNTAYYNFTYSKEGYAIQYDSIESDATEFAPYLIADGHLLSITEIYIDQELAFFDKSYFTQPYSLRVKPGMHSVVLRSRNEFITIKDVVFKEGFKLFLSIEKDSVYKFSTMEYSKAKPEYLEEEKEQIKKNLLVFNNKMTKLFYVAQENQIIKSTNYYANRSRGYTIIGPLKPGKVKVISSSLDTLEFFFQPGYVYYFTDTLITQNKDYNNQISNWIFSSRIAYQMTFKGADRAILISKPKEKIKITAKPKLNPYIRNYDKSNELKTHGALIVKFLSPRKIIRTWMVNTTDSINSKYYNTNLKNFGNLKPGDYQLVYLDKDSFYYSKSIHITADGINYRFYQDTTFLPYDSIMLKRLEGFIINLNTPKPRDFKSHPKIIKNYQATTYKNRMNMTYFKGNILDINYNPVNNAILFLEKDGIFVRGAYTNEAGFFIFTDSLEGNYQLKILVRDKTFNYYNVFIIKKLTNDVRIILPEHIGYNFYRYADANGYISNDEIFGSNSSVSYSPSYINTQKMEAVVESSPTSLLGYVSNSMIDWTLMEREPNREREATIYEGKISADSISGFKAEEKSRFDNLINDKKSNRIRSEFRDYGFFVPNLLTNKKGEAYFTVQFPDNQTLWKTYFPAVDYKRNTGLLEVDIQAYKPLSASISLPNFLIQGDICTVNGKISNYIGEAIELTPWYKVENDSISLKLTAPKHFEVFPNNISFQNLGKKEITFGFKTQTGYLDAELRTIPVLVNGIEVSTSEHFYAKNDFVITYKANSSLLSRTVFITNNQLDVLMEEIDYLKNYGYGCNEQNASKIRALLAEKSIKRALDLPFENEKTIKAIISKLEKTQNDDGSWGWWNKGNQAEIWMTIYIADAMNLAIKAGYSSSSIFNALAYLDSNLNAMNVSDRLYAIDILCNYNSPEKYKSYVLKAEKMNLSYIDKFRLISIKQKSGLPYSIQEIIQSNSRDKYGIYWGENVMNFKVNIIQTSSLAYNILKREKGNHQVMLEETRNYFLTHLSKNRNTIERAVLLQDITDDIIANNSIKNEIRSDLKINGKLMAQEFPIYLTFKNTEDIYIEKTGAPLQISVYETSIQNPAMKVDTLFEVSSVFRKASDTITSIKLGESFRHFGQYIVKKDAEFTMLEIPIPAGAVFINKNVSKLPYEINREYHHDKVVVFFRNLPKGTYYFSIDLQSRYAGEFNVIPTKISLMYFPDVFGFSNSMVFRILE